MSDFLDSLCRLPDLGDPYAEERACVERLLARVPGGLLAGARPRARHLIEAVRRAQDGWLSAQNLLSALPLASPEGTALLQLAEALLRAPDSETQTWLIAEKLATMGAASGTSSEGFAQRVLSAALRIAGHTATAADLMTGAGLESLRGWLTRTALRPLVIEGIRRFGEHFVFAPDLESALARANGRSWDRECYSFDVLGEGARTAADAYGNWAAYLNAIEGLRREPSAGSWRERDGVSAKLSALHPRLETGQWDRVDQELYARLLELAQAACAADINFTIDAEESERLVLQIALVERLMEEPALRDWPGLGLALQAYQLRAPAAMAHLLECSRAAKHPLAIRLVKGAYWDGEIKRAQELGVAGFPVFTRKWGSDLSYLALAHRLLTSDAPVFAQFGTHNAFTVAAILEMASGVPTRAFEFQRLHGMGEPLYAAVLEYHPQARVRVYAPVGAFADLLAYLVRRLLENGANTSFVHQIATPQVPIEALLADPCGQAQQALHDGQALPALAAGTALFADRLNSAGRDLQHPATLLALAGFVGSPLPPVHAAPLLAVESKGTSSPHLVRNPARLDEVVGDVIEADASGAEAAIGAAAAAFPDWNARPVGERAAVLLGAAARLDAAHDAFASLLVREGGKTLVDAHLEIREAVDLLRYYATEALRLGQPIRLPGTVGETNRLQLSGRGPFVCISPWNFPLAIFLGQITAALVTGNTVLAKPAEQTPLVACRAVELLHAAGCDRAALQFLPGPGDRVGSVLTRDPRVAGVAFTGSTATAQAINRALAARDGPIGVLIAETGGQNAMIVDASALPEQVCDAVIASSFRSGGQRCSALRVLYLQHEIADTVLAMLAGAMQELRIGDPADPRTDVGPLIDADQLAALEHHRQWLRTHARRIHECEVPRALNGHFFAPVAYEIPGIEVLTQEHFGPILHVVCFDGRDFDGVIDAINGTGYGLTCGLHTRLDARVRQVAAKVRAGNLYINRNMIGAVVGMQPFGGEGLSGTGPKAGGPHYLLRFCAERTVTVNTAAVGGNVDLAAGFA